MSEDADTMKKKISDSLNDIMGLVGKERVDFALLTNEDIMDLYKLFTNPRRVMKIARHLAFENRPGVVEDVVIGSELGTAAMEAVKGQMENRPILKALVEKLSEK